MADIEKSMKIAIKKFWTTRKRQSKKQGVKSGKRDHGARSAVTGGAQMDGFVDLIRCLLIENGISNPDVYCKKGLELPGYFRPEKKWDLIVVVDGILLATLEFKSQVGPSFGNNFNNRSEEAIGSATDYRFAYREGAFKPSGQPWLGYFMLLENAEGSRRPVRVKEPHYKVCREFRESSYAKRYEILLTKLVRERLYDSACLVLCDESSIKTGSYFEPSRELGVENFIMSLMAKAIAFVKSRKP